MAAKKQVADIDKLSKVFTTSDIAKLGIKRERLKDWMERGFIVPSIQKADGQGTKNYFSIFDLYSITLFRTLLGYGFSRHSAGFRVRWFSDAIRGDEETFWRDTPFLGFIIIPAESA